MLRRAAASQERGAPPRCKHTQQHCESLTHPGNAAHWRPAPMRLERETGTSARQRRAVCHGSAAAL